MTVGLQGASNLVSQIASDPTATNYYNATANAADIVTHFQTITDTRFLNTVDYPGAGICGSCGDGIVSSGDTIAPEQCDTGVDPTSCTPTGP
jgi:hypothetical protein